MKHPSPGAQSASLAQVWLEQGKLGAHTPGSPPARWKQPAMPKTPLGQSVLHGSSPQTKATQFPGPGPGAEAAAATEFSETTVGTAQATTVPTPMVLSILRRETLDALLSSSVVTRSPRWGHQSYGRA
jgi:hypothetical protein